MRPEYEICVQICIIYDRMCVYEQNILSKYQLYFLYRTKIKILQASHKFIIVIRLRFRDSSLSLSLSLSLARSLARSLFEIITEQDKFLSTMLI